MLFSNITLFNSSIPPELSIAVFAFVIVKLDKLNSSVLSKSNKKDPFALITVSFALFVAPIIVFSPLLNLPIDPFDKSFAVII